jgi:AraC family transcriptional regulator
MEPTNKAEAERLSAIVLASLDDDGATPGLARRAWWSRTHFHRLFRALVEETPGAMRRRLLLERAAWQLSRTRAPVTEVALDAQYGSLEAFTRAFRRAFGVSPSIYRRLGATYHRLPSAGGIHFVAPGSPSKGASDMDLFDRFAGHDSWHTRKLLEHARVLSDADLDRPLSGPVRLCHWEPASRTLRDLLDRIVYTKEIWTAALAGRALPPETPKAERSAQAMLERWERVDPEFNGILKQVRDHGSWDDTFVDALCEPPETFTFGGMFAHMMTYNSYRRLAALDIMRRYGIDDPGTGCPMEYEQSVAPRTERETVKA